MSKRKHKFITTKLPPCETKIPLPKPPPPGKMKFSFEHFQPKHKTCKKASFHRYYPKKLLERLKEFEDWTTKQFANCINNQHYRIHKIRWDDPGVKYSSFGLNEEYDAEAWQFSISKVQNGRVCGFFIYNTFYIVWLDPNHTIYSRK